MDVLVMLEEGPDHSPLLAHVNSVPSPLRSERPTREVVTLYGHASAESLALALAAAVETHRVTGENAAIRQVGVWPERGAVGDAAWHDAATGQMMSRGVAIPLETLRETARELLGESGSVIRRLAAGLSMPDWPEGARRAISFSLTPMSEVMTAVRGRGEALLDMFREADGLAYEFEGD
jgi:hypothetical protein